MYYTVWSSTNLNLSTLLSIFHAILVQLNTSDGSKIRSIQANGIFIGESNLGDAAISDDDTSVYISAKDSSNNGYLCIFNVR